MANKDQKRTNKEVRKPKQAKAAPAAGRLAVRRDLRQEEVG